MAFMELRVSEFFGKKKSRMKRGGVYDGQMVQRDYVLQEGDVAGVSRVKERNAVLEDCKQRIHGLGGQESDASLRPTACRNEPNLLG
jgi:hypothetical protein